MGAETFSDEKRGWLLLGSVFSAKVYRLWSRNIGWSQAATGYGTYICTVLCTGHAHCDICVVLSISCYVVRANNRVSKLFENYTIPGNLHLTRQRIYIYFWVLQRKCYHRFFTPRWALWPSGVRVWETGIFCLIWDLAVDCLLSHLSIIYLTVSVFSWCPATHSYTAELMYPVRWSPRDSAAPNILCCSLKHLEWHIWSRLQGENTLLATHNIS